MCTPPMCTSTPTYVPYQYCIQHVYAIHVCTPMYTPEHMYRSGRVVHNVPVLLGVIDRYQWLLKYFRVWSDWHSDLYAPDLIPVYTQSF